GYVHPARIRSQPSPDRAGTALGAWDRDVGRSPDALACRRRLTIMLADPAGPHEQRQDSPSPFLSLPLPFLSLTLRAALLEMPGISPRAKVPQSGMDHS